MTQRLGDGFEFKKKACFVCGSFNHLIKDCDFHDNKMVEKLVLNNKGRVTGQREVRPLWNNGQRVNHQNKLTHPHPKRNFVPTAVATKSGQVLVNSAKQSSPRVATSISTARPYIHQVNNVTTAGSKAVVSAAEGNGENAVKSSACWIRRPTGNVIDHNSKESGSYMLKRFNYVDLQGRLKHMTRNKSFLTDYQDIDGGFVEFAGSAKRGKITGKGKIRTEKLDFEDDETLEILKNFITGIENQTDHKVKTIRCDNGTEFKNRFINEFYEMKGIRREFSVARTPQQNGVAKRKNRTLIEAARTMLADSKLPTTFWAEKPALSFMRPFRCPVTILNTLDYIGKFDGKSDDGFFIGYSINSKAFKVFNTRTRFVEENLHINFLENKSNVIGTGPNWMFDIDTLTMSMNYQPVFAGNQTNGNAGTKANIDEGQGGMKTVPGPQYVLLPFLTFDSQSPKSSKDEVDDDARKKNGVLDPAKEDDKSGQREATNTNNKDTNGNNIYRMFTLVNAAGSSCDNLSGSIPVNAATLPNDDLPTDPLMPEDTTDLLNTGIFSGAYDNEDVGVEADLNNLETTMNKVWRLVDLPKGKHAIGTKWVYRNKKDGRGIVVRNKARLVAQGYTQEEGIDYDEVFAPVVRIEAIRLFLAYASFMRFIVYQIDMKSTFLYGTIEEEVYVCQPPGFEDPQFPDKVYKVEKALYGLHQAPRAWYETLSTYLLENGFRRGTIDKTLFIKKNKGDILLVQVYIDDIIFGSTKKSLCVEFEQMMHKRFQMSSMGELTFFLGLKVKQKDDGIFISQDKYVADILKKFDFVTVKTTSTPIENNKALLKNEEAEDVDVHLYRSMIGSLMYLTASRPDIMFVVCACARFQVTPKVSHLHAVKRIFRYLKGQPKLGLWCPKDSPFDLEAFLDSDYAGASLDRKSTTGGCQFLGKRLISWQCKKQTVVSNSTTEAEYVAAANCRGQNPTIYVSLIEKFWPTATVKTVDNGEQEITAIVDGKEFTITEASVRRHLQLADVEGISALPTTEIFDQLSLMGYVLTDDKLTFQKGKFSPQWRFLIHTILHCLSPKKTSWEQFSSNIATAIICLATNRTFNFSKLIFDGMVKNLDSKYKFLMYPRFIQIFLDKNKRFLNPHNRKYIAPALTPKLFSNMKRGFSGEHTPLFPSMLAIQAEEGEGSGHPSEPQPPPSTAQPIHEEPIPNVVSSSHQKTQTPRQALNQVTELPQTSEPIPNVADEAVYEEWDDRVERATTTAASLDAAQASAKEGKGLGHPSEPQPPPSNAQPTYEEPIPNVESSSPQNTQILKQALQEDTQLPQTSVPIPNVADKAVFKEWDNKVVRATTTAASFDAA
ncbi:putative ribonuclease H-like domain-containing protein [Tanacetum coccineum]